MGLFDIFKKKIDTAMAESVTTNNDAAVKEATVKFAS